MRVKHAAIIFSILLFSIILNVLWINVINIPTIESLRPTDVMEVDEIGLYSDGNVLVIYNFKEDYTLYQSKTMLSTKYYSVPNTVQDVSEYLKKNSSNSLNTYTDYFNFSESKWGGSLTIKEFEYTLNQGKFEQLVKE